jgi:transposase-like protein
VSMTSSPNRIEVVTSVQRRRRWTASGKVRMVEETFAPGMTVSLVARQHDVAPNQSFTWRRQPDCGRQRRGGGAGVGLSGVAEPGSRASSAARQEDPGGRFSRRLWNIATSSKKQLRLPPLPPKDDTR